MTAPLRARKGLEKWWCTKVTAASAGAALCAEWCLVLGGGGEGYSKRGGGELGGRAVSQQGGS